mmetsp:Transcript_34516/g.81368  ORF Transcript_34516/g.81368 Transcript_34516/m.81368 type:complete len:444 (+) Transcript_34516:151-1482(+)
MSVDVMCNSQQPRLTENTQSRNNVDRSRSHTKPHLEEENLSSDSSEESNGPIVLESKILSLTSSIGSGSSLIPNVPFSNTFGKSELSLGKKSENLRSSIDCEHKSSKSDYPLPLRRRARSSEGYILKSRRTEYFDQDSHFGARNSIKEREFNLSYLGTKSEIRRRKYWKGSARNFGQMNPGGRPRRLRSRSVIPIEHPFKIVWDICTVILSVVHSYLTHMAIRDRRFEPSPFIAFCQAWFLVDILLNFFTERKTNTGEIISNPRRIVARYLTSWFVVDILSLFPWEVLYVKPLIEVQNRRGFFKKSFFRSKAVVRVTTHLRGKHFRWFGAVAKHTKHHGIGAQRLLRLIIKYVPKYVMFLRNMKGVVAVRILRFVHWSRRSIKNIESKSSDASTSSLSTMQGDDDKDFSEADENSFVRKKQKFQVLYDWENFEEDEDDDGVPL